MIKIIMQMDKKKALIIGFLFLIILLISGYLFFGRKQSQKLIQTSSLPTEAVIPTVDGNVKVDLVSSSEGREVVLQIKNIPPQTTKIRFELSYNTKNQGIQGIIETIELKKGQTEVSKRRDLGTCSSGACIYHQVVGKIKLNLEFTGDYGQRVYEGEYKI